MRAKAMSASIIRGRRQDRERITAFDALIETPHDLGASDLVMPASGRLAISHTAALSLGQVTISIVTGRVSFSNPTLVANAIHRGSWAEKGTRVSQTGAPVGTLSLYLVNPIDGTTKVIATQTVI